MYSGEFYEVGSWSALEGGTLCSGLWSMNLSMATGSGEEVFQVGETACVTKAYQQNTSLSLFAL